MRRFIDWSQHRILTFIIIQMLVRQQTKEIAISRQGKVLSVTQEAREYAVRKKVYNFNQICNDDEEPKCAALTDRQASSTRGNASARGEEEEKRLGRSGRDVGGRAMQIKNANSRRNDQRMADDEDEDKGESHTLLKIVASILAILIVLTLIKAFSPSTHIFFIQTLSSLKTSVLSHEDPSPNDL